MSDLNYIEVTISDTSITFVSDENEEYIKKLADYVDKKIRNINSFKGGSLTRSQSILLGMNIADDYFKEQRKKQARPAPPVKTDEVIILNEKIERLQEELDLKAEVLSENYELKEKVKQLEESLELESDEKKRLLDRTSKLEKELAEAKKELEDFINTFEG